MQIKSKAQRRKFAELLVKGETTSETFEEWNRAAGDAELPERLHPRVAAKSKRTTKSKRAPKAKTARARSEPAFAALKREYGDDYIYAGLGRRVVLQ